MKCKICGNKDFFTIYSVKEMEYGIRSKHEYLFCECCGCLQIKEIPDNLGKYYSSDYYSYKSKLEKNLVKKLLKSFRDKYILTSNKFNILGLLLSKFSYSDERLKSFGKIVRKYNVQKDAKILDVGSGTGSFLISLQNIGFKNLYGIDPFIENDIHYPNINIYKKHIFDYNPDFKFDLIIFNHSFEHLIEDPFGVLKKINRILKRDGICVIRMPTTSSYLWEKYKENWVGIQAPRHIIVYSIRGIEILSSSTGFTLEMLFNDSTEFSFIASEQYKKDIALHEERSFFENPEKSIFSKEDIQLFKEKTENLNKGLRGDMIVAVMRKGEL